MKAVKPFKNCNGCKANDADSCSLGYERDSKPLTAFSTEYIPLEPCPKPRTTKQLVAEYIKKGKL